MNDRQITADVREARERLSQLGRWYAARPGSHPSDEMDEIIAADRELERVARIARLDLVVEVDRRAGLFDTNMLEALLEVPRERFVRSCDIAESTIDAPLLLDEQGLATVSAPHAYLLSFRVLGLAAGHRLAELGAGSGYGAALASHVVTASGEVFSIEIDPGLARRAKRLASPYANVRVVCADASDIVDQFRGFERVSVTFAIDEIPRSWVEGLPEGGRLVAPVGREAAQRLVCVERKQGELTSSDHGAVRYVRNRGHSPSF